MNLVPSWLQRLLSAVVFLLVSSRVFLMMVGICWLMVLTARPGR